MTRKYSLLAGFRGFRMIEISNGGSNSHVIYLHLNVHMHEINESEGSDWRVQRRRCDDMLATIYIVLMLF